MIELGQQSIFNKIITHGRTDGRTDQRTDGLTNGRTHVLIEMRGRFFSFFKMDLSSQELRNRKSVPHIKFKHQKYNAVRIELRVQIVHRLYQMPPPTYYVSLSVEVVC